MSWNEYDEASLSRMATGINELVGLLGGDRVSDRRERIATVCLAALIIRGQSAATAAEEAIDYADGLVHLLDVPIEGQG